MKQLFLVRHAKSSWADDSLSDRERPLNARGQSQLAPLGRALAADNAFAGDVYASAAVRARATLAGLEPATLPSTRIEVCPELYTFDYRALLHWLREQTDATTVTLIGHNPALLELAQWLLPQPPKQLPTASYLHLCLPVASWQALSQGSGQLERLLTPADFSYEHFARKQRKRAGSRPKPRQGDPAATLQDLNRWLADLERGVRLGFDPEFLHQYRIALRRSRAIAEAIQEVTGAKRLAGPVKQLKHRARTTSRLRDLHVLLQQLPNLCDGNDELETGLHTYFEQAVATEQRRLTEALSGKGKQEPGSDWQDLVESKGFRKLARSLNHKDIRKTVHQRMKQCQRRALKLTMDSPDDQIHGLRKLLKRTRYLMELEPERWQGPLKRVKRRQELFGSFQDLCVQTELLQQFRKDSPEALPAAVAGLEHRLITRKTDIRQQILALGGLDGSPL